MLTGLLVGDNDQNRPNFRTELHNLSKRINGRFWGLLEIQHFSYHERSAWLLRVDANTLEEFREYSHPVFYSSVRPTHRSVKDYFKSRWQGSHIDDGLHFSLVECAFTAFLTYAKAVVAGSLPKLPIVHMLKCFHESKSHPGDAWAMDLTGLLTWVLDYSKYRPSGKELVSFVESLESILASNPQVSGWHDSYKMPLSTGKMRHLDMDRILADVLAPEYFVEKYLREKRETRCSFASVLRGVFSRYHFRGLTRQRFTDSQADRRDKIVQLLPQLIGNLGHPSLFPKGLSYDLLHFLLYCGQEPDCQVGATIDLLVQHSADLHCFFYPSGTCRRRNDSPSTGVNEENVVNEPHEWNLCDKEVLPSLWSEIGLEGRPCFVTDVLQCYNIKISSESMEKIRRSQGEMKEVLKNYTLIPSEPHTWWIWVMGAA